MMPPSKQLHWIKEKSETGSEARGSGSQSRIGLYFDKLREAGRRITHSLLFSPGFKITSRLRAISVFC